MKKVVGERNEMEFFKIIGGLLCIMLSIVGMLTLEPEGAVILILPLIMSIAVTVWGIVVIILIPNDIVIFEDDTITVFVRRNKSVSFKASEIEDTDVFSWGRGRVNANMTFKLVDGREVVARHITNTDEIYNELLKLKKRNEE